MKYIYKIFALLIVIISSSCEDTNELHQPYLDLGETIYTEKPDSLISTVGRNRTKLQWYQYSDLTIKSGRVYWNEGTDSVDVVINIIPSQRNEVSVIVDNLDEGTYGFTVHSVDAAGNKSVPVRVNSRVLGDIYEAGLNNRRLISHSTTATDITFNLSTVLYDDYVTTEVNYFNLAGNPQMTSFSEEDLTNKSLTINLTEIDTLKNITYRSVYRPNGNSIDDFYSGYLNYVIE
jgi:hypothetical protein